MGLKRWYKISKGGVFIPHLRSMSEIETPSWIIKSSVLQKYASNPKYDVLLDDTLYTKDTEIGKYGHIRGLMEHIPSVRRMPDSVERAIGILEKWAKRVACNYLKHSIYESIVNAVCVLYLYQVGDRYFLRVDAGDTKFSLSFSEDALENNTAEKWYAHIGNLDKSQTVKHNGVLSGEYAKVICKKACYVSSLSAGYRDLAEDDEIVDMLLNIKDILKEVVTENDIGMLVLGVSIGLYDNEEAMILDFQGVGTCPNYAEGSINLAMGEMINEKSVIFFRQVV